MQNEEASEEVIPEDTTGKKVSIQKEPISDNDNIQEETTFKKDSTQENEKVSRPKLCCSARLFLCLGCFCAFFSLAYVRVGMGMAFVCMIIPPKVVRRDLGQHTGEFEWSSTTKGYLMSAVFYGFLIGPFLGGYLSFKFHGKIVMVIGTIGAGATNFIVPEATRFSPACFFALRVVTGVFGGFIAPGFFDLMSHWVVAEESQLLIAGVLVALPLANILNFPIMCATCTMLGWVWVFYTIAIWMVFLGIVLCFTLADYPKECRCISRQELLYLQHSIPRVVKAKIPWKKIFTSVPVYAYIVMHFTINYIFISMIVSMPLFLREVLHVTLEMNGFLSALPFVGSLTTRIMLSLFFERLRLKLNLSKNTLRKTFVFAGAFSVSCFLLAASLLSVTYVYWILICFLFTMMGLELCMTGGYLLSPLDMCPGYVNIISGIANTVGNSAGLIGPVVNGFITPSGSKEEWNIVFYVDITLILLAAIVYLVFGRNKPLPWGNDNLQPPPPFT